MTKQVAEIAAQKQQAALGGNELAIALNCSTTLIGGLSNLAPNDPALQLLILVILVRMVMLGQVVVIITVLHTVIMVLKLKSF